MAATLSLSRSMNVVRLFSIIASLFNCSLSGKRPSAVCMLSACKGMVAVTAMKENDRDECQLSWYLSRFSFHLLHVLVFSIMREWQVSQCAMM